MQAVGEDGTPLPEVQTGLDHREWFFDATGQDRVGFAISMQNYCFHSWGEGFRVDSVKVR